MARKSNSSKHYVNNDDFYNALKAYKLKCTIAEKVWEQKHKEELDVLLSEGKTIKEIIKLKLLSPVEYPKVPDYIGACVFDIATRLMRAPNFAGYTYRDDMIGDAYEVCIRHIRVFDPEKSTKPFSFFTQACYFAAVQRIKKEKKQAEIKSNMIMNSGILAELDMNTMTGDDSIYRNTVMDFLHETTGHTKTDAELDQSSRKVIKKTTKAHQKRLADLAQMEEEQSERDRILADDYKKIDNDVLGGVATLKQYYDIIKEVEDLDE